MTLTEILEPTRVSDREFTVLIPDGWQQGRGAFGGLIVGGLIRCIEAVVAEPARVLRSLTCEIAGPVPPGTWTVEVETLRRGNSVSTVRASLVANGEVLADAVGVLGSARPGMPRWNDLRAPGRPDWRRIPPAPMGPPIAPVFTQHLEYRVTGPAPYSGGAEAIASGWVRPKDPGPARGSAYLGALIDAWWPAAMARFEAPRPLATLTFTLEIIGTTEGLDPEAPLLYSASSPVCQDGYLVEFRQLRGEDGRLLALNQQTFAIIK